MRRASSDFLSPRQVALLRGAGFGHEEEREEEDPTAEEEDLAKFLSSKCLRSMAWLVRESHQAPHRDRRSLVANSPLGSFALLTPRRVRHLASYLSPQDLAALRCASSTVHHILTGVLTRHAFPVSPSYSDSLLLFSSSPQSPQTSDGLLQPDATPLPDPTHISWKRSSSGGLLLPPRPGLPRRGTKPRAPTVYYLDTDNALLYARASHAPTSQSTVQPPGLARYGTTDLSTTPPSSWLLRWLRFPLDNQPFRMVTTLLGVALFFLLLTSLMELTYGLLNHARAPRRVGLVGLIASVTMMAGCFLGRRALGYRADSEGMLVGLLAAQQPHSRSGSLGMKERGDSSSSGIKWRSNIGEPRIEACLV